MMAIVYAVPFSLTILEHYRKLAGICIFFWCLQISNLGLLLMQPAPSEAWQQRSGVFISTDTCHAEVAQAQKLLSQTRQAGESSRVYVFDTSSSFAAFLSVGYYASLISPDKPSFEVEFPVNWEDASVIRIHDMATSDYLLFQPVYDPVARKHLLTIPSVEDFSKEKLLFQAALTDFTEQDGIQKVSETSVRLLKVIDRARLLKSLEAVQRGHSWPAVFVNANPKECWTLQELRDTLQS